jgi:hypothetical protein
MPILKKGLAALFAAVTGMSAIGGSASAGGPAATYLSPEAKAWVIFSGFDAIKDARYLYNGVILALNRDIGKDGFVLRAYGSHTDYEYSRGTAGVVAGDAWQGDAMIGYKVGRDRWWAAAYIGVDYQSFHLTPDDPSSLVRGSKTGFKVAADMATLRDQSPFYFSASGNYSTAFESYWARGRIGANVHRVTFGPEFVALGNKGFEATRVGGFVTFDLPLTRANVFEVTLSAGQQSLGSSSSSGSSGGEGTYFGVSLSTLF